MTESRDRDAASAASPADAGASVTRPTRKRTNPLLLILMGVIPAAAIGWAMYEAQVRKPVQENKEMNSALVYNMLGRPGESAPLKLADRFQDADHDLVADTPTDPKQQIDPPTLTFSYVGTSEPEGYRERFKDFVSYLSQQVGRPVEYALFRSPEEELNAMRDGKLHVAGINTGNIPLAVDECGFVPACELGTESGVASYHMQVIVPADSTIQNLADLKGRELTLTEAGSNSGFKAPLVLLAKKQGLRPGHDFAIRYSQGHRESIAGIAEHKYQAAAVASDILQRAMAEDPPLIRKEQFRVIYESDPFPTAGFGYVYNLKPELAKKVTDAFFAFQWKGTGVEKEFAASAQTRFVPVSFKENFALVRTIDDEIRSIRSDISIPDYAASTQAATTQSIEPPTTTATTQSYDQSARPRSVP